MLSGAIAKDDAPRVRERWALRALAGAPALPVDVMAARLEKDEWTFGARGAAAEALASAPASPAVDDALGHALEDSSPSVRELAIGALAAHAKTAPSVIGAIRARLVDPNEVTSVRVAAARASAKTCDTGALDALTEPRVARAPALRDRRRDPARPRGGRRVLGHLHPRDLAARLAPFAAKDAREESRAAAARALATPASCR